MKKDHKNRKKSLAISIQKAKYVLKILRNVFETINSIEMMLFLYYLFWKILLKEINFIDEFLASAVERKLSASKKKTVLNVMKGR